MPIGKNSIKRVMNSGYSKVSTSAPDMENSHIEEEKKAPARKPAQAKKPAAKKATPAAEAKAAAPKAKTAAAAKKPAEAKKAAPKAEKPAELKPISDLSPASRLEVVVERVAPEAKDEEGSVSYVNLGRELPVHLL